MTSKNIKIADTQTLIHLNDVAGKDRLNRAIDSKWLKDNVDPMGVHVVSQFMVHYSKNSKPLYTCMVLVKTNDNVAPVEAWLNVYPEDYDALPLPIQTQLAV